MVVSISSSDTIVKNLVVSFKCSWAKFFFFVLSCKHPHGVIKIYKDKGNGMKILEKFLFCRIHIPIMYHMFCWHLCEWLALCFGIGFGFRFEFAKQHYPLTLGLFSCHLFKACGVVLLDKRSILHFYLPFLSRWWSSKRIQKKKLHCWVQSVHISIILSCQIGHSKVIAFFFYFAG